LKHRFADKVNENLPVFGIEKNNLTDFTTTEKDMKRGVSRFPPLQLRLMADDILKKSDSSAVSSKGGIILGEADVDNTFEFSNEFQQNVEIRNKQFQESKNF
jgi:hypothetical protein